MTRLYKSAEKDNIRLSIFHDDNAESPRESYDHLGTMVCWHNRYKLGDENPKETPEEWESEHDKSKMVMLPLYLYDHSGITMKTSSFQCRWDSGQVGFIYISYEDIQKEWGAISKENLEKARKLLESEVKEYNLYLTGEVYGYKLEESKKCDCCSNIEWEEIDSCWGFFSDNIEKDLIGQVPEEYRHLLEGM